MRLVLLAAVAALGCGGSRSASHSGPPAEVAGFSATRWVPANPTFVLTAPTVREAQRSLRDVIDSFGMIVGVESAEIATGLTRLLAVDPMNPDALAAMGIDIEGGFAAFSEDLSPTIVVRLGAPEQTQAFFDQQRERGLVTQSVIVNGTEVFSAQLPAPVRISWAIADDWLWVHFTLPFARDTGTTWFSNSQKPQGPGWARDWQWAQDAVKTAHPTLTGFVDAKDLLALVSSRIPQAVSCVKLLEPVSRVAIAIEGDGTRAGGQLAFDLGPAAASVSAAILPVPEGFAAQAAGAPLSAQWNLDLLAVRAWVQPCMSAMREDLGWLDRYGVRSGRAVLLSFDPDDKSGSGAIALDLAHKKFFASQLDDVPMRSTLERSRTYGPHAGHSLSIPFVATVDYVLTDTLALAAVGDGLLARVVGGGGGTRGPLAAIDVVPAAMSVQAWKTIVGAIDRRNAAVFVERLMRWREGHVAVTIEGTSLMLSAAGTRR
ncbi:MAG: hypothetical protein JWP01_3033 [Myxococcales bacterium]|nr:hypothetical protein [Myxococcales bacterium]